MLTYAGGSVHYSETAHRQSIYVPDKQNVILVAVSDWSITQKLQTTSFNQLPSEHPAIALLRSWREEDPQQQRADWEALKQVLEEDRSSERELFP